MMACLRIGFITLVAVLLTACLGCSGGGSAVAPPPEPEAHSTAGSSHILWGLWQFVADPQAGTLDIVELRSPEMHLNALHFLEPPPFVYLTLESLLFNGNIVEANIGLRHPFLAMTEFTGFDVCGIIFTNGSVSGFTDPDLLMAGEGDTRLLNPDGHSRWWNPAEFPHGGTMFSYKDGLLGTPDSKANYNSTLNAYKYFCDDLGPLDPLSKVTLGKRGMFSAGKKNIRHYTIDMGWAGLIFNYAIDANWQFPTGGPPWVAPNDFAPEANRPEARRAEVTEVDNTLWNDGTGSGGNLSLSIDVYDWYKGGLNEVTVESPGNFMPVSSATPTGGGAGYSTYEIEILGATPAQESIDLLISVESEVVGYGDLLPGKPVTAYFTYAAAVSGEPPCAYGWAQTWGGIDGDEGFGVAVGPGGNAYVAGRTFQSDSEDIFLWKCGPCGESQWAKTWGGKYYDQGQAVAVDGSGNIYILGWFYDTIDFDPGTGTDNHSSNGAQDVFLSKFNPSGAFLWAHTWGGPDTDYGRGIVVDGSDNIYVTGSFSETVDFDPGTGTDNHISSGYGDVFLSKFGPSGTYKWARTWGGVSGEEGRGAAADSSGNIYVAGWFAGIADFDPGTGTDNHSSNGMQDVFLSKIDSSGTFQWARTWGGALYDEGQAVAVDGLGNIYAAGTFADVVDFDPDGGDPHTSHGVGDSFLSKYDPSGNFQWARTWGAATFDYCYGAAADSTGHAYVTGMFWDMVDFDPGSEFDFHSSNGKYDVYLSKFDSSGIYQWARTWGGISSDESHTAAVDSSDNVYVTGSFEDTVDFDPDGGDPHASNGDEDAYVIKFLPDGSW